ncbi:MAG: hypothetical protein HKN36_02450 [Hellea sp.]|nr:hypothetical protein [Hellea sp.]
MRKISYLLPILVLAACKSPAPDTQDKFMAHLADLCGQSFEGKVISKDEVDDDWRKDVMTIHVRDCDEDEIKIPLHVGDNRSRTWIVTDNGPGLTLNHDHRHEDGEPDKVSLYGGDTAAMGTEFVQSFPVDDFSKELFRREGLEVSMQNTWALTIDPGKTLTYALSRPNRDFRAQFDLTKPVETPPPAWGSE